MDYNKYTLVPYDGVLIPQGYIFDDMSAKFTISYLKSLGSNFEAIDKVKELEVSKVMYGLTLKDVNASMTLSHDGKKYGAGTQKPIPGSVIHSLTETGKLPDGWEVEYTNDSAKGEVGIYSDSKGQKYSKQPVTGNNHQVIQTGDIVNAAKTGKIPSRKLNILNKDNKVVCSMSYDDGSDVVLVDKGGNLPNIWLNLIEALRIYDSHASEKALKQFSVNKDRFSVDIRAIPPEVRSGIMAKVLNPDTHFTELREMNSKNVHTGMMNYPPDVLDSMGEGFSEGILSLITSLNFRDFINSKDYPKIGMKGLFPVLYRKTEAARDSEGKIPQDFEFTKDMFLPSVNFTNNDKFLTNLKGIVKAYSKLPVGISSSLHPIVFLTGQENSEYADSVDTMLFPIFNVVATEKYDAKTILFGLLSKENGVNDKIKSESIDELITKLKNANISEYSDRTFTSGKHISSIIDSLGLSTEADVVLGLLVKSYQSSINSQDNSPFLKKYSALTLDSTPRVVSNMVHTKIAEDVRSYKLAGDSDSLRGKRVLYTFLAIMTTASSLFSSSQRESDFVVGQTHVHDSLELINSCLINNGKPVIEKVDLIPFFKVPPILHRDGVVKHVTSDSTILSCDFTTASEYEKARFVEKVASDLNLLIKSGVIPSERAVASGALMQDFDLPISIDTKPTMFKRGTSQKLHNQVAGFIADFTRGFSDPFVNDSREAVKIGGIQPISANGKKLKEAMSDKALKAELQVITNRGGLLKYSEKTKEHISKLLEGRNSFIENVVHSSLKYDASMDILSQRENVLALIEGRYDDLSSKYISPLLLQEVKDIVKSVGFSNFNFEEHIEESNPVLKAKKVQAVRDFLILNITTSALYELDRRRAKMDNEKDFTSMVRQSVSFESLSSLGNFVSMLNSKPGVDFDYDSPTADDRYVISQAIKLKYADGTKFLTGMRNNLDKVTGGFVDTMGYTIDEDSIRFHLGELKISQNKHQIAHINATRQVMKAIKNLTESNSPPKRKVIIEPVTNSSYVYGRKRTGYSDVNAAVNYLSFSMNVRNNTEYGLDGNQGEGLLR